MLRFIRSLRKSKGEWRGELRGESQGDILGEPQGEPDIECALRLMGWVSLQEEWPASPELSQTISLMLLSKGLSSYTDVLCGLLRWQVVWSISKRKHEIPQSSSEVDAHHAQMHLWKSSRSSNPLSLCSSSNFITFFHHAICKLCWWIQTGVQRRPSPLQRAGLFT